MQSHEQSSGSPALLELSPGEFREHPSAAQAPARLTPARTFEYRVIKRGMEVILVLLSTPVTIPICAFLGLCVVLSSPGPVFFSHRRIGRGGIFFSMWKFRTMCVNSAEVLEQHLAQHPEEHAEWNSFHKLRNDPRVTPLGKMLRRYSLDELPQLWNVLTGRMSLVGPRPIVAAEAEKYGNDFACYLAVKPGLTGLWQTSGRSTLTYEERVALDRTYVETWSLSGDLRILFRTFTRIVNSDDAY